MRRDVIHLLVGYDPLTEKVVYRHAIPSSKLKVLSWISHDADDPDLLDSYPLEYPMARDIMVHTGLPSGEIGYEYFLESKAAAIA
jgi:hypothetical protein